MIYMRNITITTAKSATYLENVGLLDRKGQRAAKVRELQRMRRFDIGERTGRTADGRRQTAAVLNTQGGEKNEKVHYIGTGDCCRLRNDHDDRAG